MFLWKGLRKKNTITGGGVYALGYSLVVHPPLLLHHQCKHQPKGGEIMSKVMKTVLISQALFKGLGVCEPHSENCGARETWRRTLDRGPGHGTAAPTAWECPSAGA